MKHCVPPELPPPSGDEVAELPTSLQTAVSGRTLRILLPNRLLKHLPAQTVEALDDALRQFEESGHGCRKWAPSSFLKSEWHELHAVTKNLQEFGDDSPETGETWAAYWWADVITEHLLFFGDASGCADGVDESCRAVFDLLVRSGPLCNCVAAETRRLVEVARSFVQAGGDSSFLSSGQFLGTHAVFDDESPLTSPTAAIVQPLNISLVDVIARRPVDMFRLSPREFEELIADIMNGLGCSVELTARTRDGGRDIIAISSRERRKYLVECKRYRNEPIGIGIVQRLGGVLLGEPATKGIVVTTSYFSRSAREYLDRQDVRWRLDGKDFWGIVDWLAEYERLRARDIHSVALF